MKNNVWVLCGRNRHPARGCTFSLCACDRSSSNIWRQFLLRESPKSLYQKAKASGIHHVARAGEEGPVEYIGEALQELDVERIEERSLLS